MWNLEFFCHHKIGNTTYFFTLLHTWLYLIVIFFSIVNTFLPLNFIEILPGRDFTFAHWSIGTGVIQCKGAFFLWGLDKKRKLKYTDYSCSNVTRGIQLCFYHYFDQSNIKASKRWANRRASSQVLILNRYTVGSGRLVMWLWGCWFSLNAVCQPRLWLCGTLPGSHWESEAWICQSGTPTDGWSPLKLSQLLCSLKGKSS